VKIVVGYCATAERIGEPVGGGDWVLDSHVYSDAGDGRHRVRRIADADLPRPLPSSQSIDSNAEEFDVVPALQFADTIGEKRRHLDDPLAESPEAL